MATKFVDPLGQTYDQSTTIISPPGISSRLIGDLSNQYCLTPMISISDFVICIKP